MSNVGVSKQQASLLLATSVIILAVLLGWLGFRAYQKYVVPVIHPAPASSAAVFVPMPMDEPDVSKSLASTSRGTECTITIDNKTSVKFDEVTITGLQFDTFPASALPRRVTNVAPHTTKRIVIPISGLRTTNTSYESIQYSFKSASSSGSASTSYGIPPGTKSVSAKPPPTGFVDVEICADSHELATMYCPKTIVRSFPKAAAPTTRCHLHHH